MLKKLSQFIDSPYSSQQTYKKDKKSLNESFDFLALIRAWKEIAGAKLSEHTIPLKNQNGVLIILSNHSAFANELSYMELALKKKIVDKFPNLEKSILSIKFIVDSTHFNQQYSQFIAPIEKKASQLLHPYSPEFRRLKKEAEEFFIDLDDLEVKEKMISLYIQSFKK
ncbi:MAG: DUF721 domain-containing protein [Bacteriovorax sp.]|nr:DUF721 domain-containing protein [Bacteriovorax sp.]